MSDRVLVMAQGRIAGELAAAEAHPGHGDGPRRQRPRTTPATPAATTERRPPVATDTLKSKPGAQGGATAVCRLLLDNGALTALIVLVIAMSALSGRLPDHGQPAQRRRPGAP